MTPVATPPPPVDRPVAALAASGLVAGYRRGRRHRAVVTADGLAARAGEVTAVIGPNGSGKSTLLRTLVGAQPALAGVVTVEGTRLARLGRTERARRLAVVLTDRVEPGMLTVGEVVTLGRHPHTGWRGDVAAHDAAVAWRAAAALDIADQWEAPFGEISDGQRQRALVARALAQEPTVLVLDEPTAFLDLPGRVSLTVTLAELARDHGLAVVIATHELDLALTHADVVWLVDAGRVHSAAPEDLLLDGTLVDAFATGAIEIEPATGAMRARRPPGPSVVVHGDGLADRLAARAAARAGATVVDPRTATPPADAWEIARPVASADDRNAPTWVLRRGTTQHTASSLDDLARHLRAHIDDP